MRRTDATDADGDNGSDNGGPEVAEPAPSEPAEPTPPAKESADAAPPEPNSSQGAILCPCCGSGMDLEKRIGPNSALYRCTGCNMSETRLD